MTLIEALEQNVVSGINGPTEKVIETVLSKVFLYKNSVLKIYKHSKNFIGDFEDFNFRKDFYQQDFSWNQTMSPSVYLALKPFKMTDGLWQLCGQNEAEDFLIEMSRVDTRHDLLSVCLENRLTKEMIKNLVDDFEKRITSLTQQQREILPSFKASWSKLFNDRLDEIPKWCEMSGNKQLNSEIGEIISKIKIVVQDPYIKNLPNKSLQAAIDNQAVNIVFEGNEPVFIDVYLMKEFWRVADPCLNVCRMAVDIKVLSGEENEHILLEEYKKYYSLPPEHIYFAYMIYNALIMAPYFYMLHKDDVADKYVSFIHQNLIKIG